jgi:hypothetical protein
MATSNILIGALGKTFLQFNPWKLYVSISRATRQNDFSKIGEFVRVTQRIAAR